MALAYKKRDGFLRRFCYEKTLWFYIVLAMGCMLWFASCDAVVEFLGMGEAVNEEDTGR
jgi:hypothetical protein